MANSARPAFVAIRFMLVLTAVALAPAGVRAQLAEPTDKALERWQPGLDVEAIAGVNVAARPLVGAYELWLNLGYAGNTLTVADYGAGTQGALVGPRFISHLGGSLTLLPRLQVGVNLPVILYQARGDAPPASFGSVGELAGSGVGDLNLAAKVHLLSREQAFFDIAAIAGLGLPTHYPRDAYLGDGGVTASMALAASRRILGFGLATNLGYYWRGSERFIDAELGPEVRLSAAADYSLESLTSLPLGVGAAWAMAARHDAPFKRINETPSEVLFEATWSAWAPVVVSAAAGFGLVAGIGTPDVRAMIEVRWAPRVTDSDGDRIPDSIDACPKDPEDYDGFEDQDGCSDPDNDGDGIEDGLDDCPSDAETLNEFDDEDGCPDQGAIMESGRIALEGTVQFEVAKAILMPKSRTLLDEVVALLVQHPEVKRVRIEGHTDGDGDEKANQVLSQARASAVRDYLIEHGIAAERLVAEGFGESRPRASNATVLGRALNRRVEFLIEEVQ